MIFYRIMPVIFGHYIALTSTTARIHTPRYLPALVHLAICDILFETGSL